MMAQLLCSGPSSSGLPPLEEEPLALLEPLAALPVEPAPSGLLEPCPPALLLAEPPSCPPAAAWGSAPWEDAVPEGSFPLLSSEAAAAQPVAIAKLLASHTMAKGRKSVMVRVALE